VELLFVGRRGRLDREILSRSGITSTEIDIHGFDRDAPWRNVSLAWLVPGALVQARSLLARFRPDAVLATGGDVSLPVVAMAAARGVPSVTLELNAVPGLSTRLLARLSRVVATAFSRTAGLLPARTRVSLTGTPVRQEFLTDADPPRVPPRRLLVFGGSLGSRRLNAAVLAALPGLMELGLEVDHVVGGDTAGAEERERLAREYAGRYSVTGFAHDLPQRLAAADLVVARAGGSGLAEIAASGRPAVVVPGNFGGGHQRPNALAASEAGFAVLVEDAQFDGPRLLSTVRELVADPERLRQMAAAARAWARPDAADRVAQLVLETACSR
jgi:UDP-N-acetylglucosamine--N-acetylmuramyl-(pentapeptide) pyrophosphoryl-undecaprenol N-acetylglucosamine transferase